MEVFRSSYLIMRYDEELQCLFQHWEGFATSEQFRQGIFESLELISHYPITKFLTDTRNQDVVRKEDTDWLTQEIIPQISGKNVQYQAFVLPTDKFTQMSIVNFKLNFPNGIYQVEYFDDIEKAKYWLSIVDKA